MEKPLQDRMSLTLDELKELEPEFASDIEAVDSGNVDTFEWLATRLYLAAYHQGYRLGRMEQLLRSLSK